MDEVYEWLVYEPYRHFRMGKRLKFPAFFLIFDCILIVLSSVNL